MLNNFKALAILIVLKCGAFIWLNAVRCPVNKLDFYHYYTSIPHQEHTSCIRQKHCSETNYAKLIPLVFRKEQDTQTHHNV